MIEESGKYSDPIRIRAYHLLCIQGFQGYGYSDNFVSHMRRVISFLKLNQYSDIQIVDDIDELCSKCPHNIDDRCFKESSHGINKVDKLIIENTGLDLKHIYTIHEAFSIINQNLDKDLLLFICSDCSWKNKCLFSLKVLI